MLIALRRELSEMTESVALHEHPARIESLRSKFSHSIIVVESGHPIERYTCGVHAFHLIENPTYLAVAAFGLGKTFAGAEFIEFLLRRGLLSARGNSPALPGDLILYFNNNVFRHVGRLLTDSRVLSKWGTGYFYEHGVWEAPLNYGENVQYFVGPSEDASFDMFIQYAKSKGFNFMEPPQP